MNSPFKNDTLPDQRFGVVLTVDNLRVAAPLSENYGSESYFPWRKYVAPISNADLEKIKFLKENFAVHVDVFHFALDEVIVSITPTYCDVTASHNEREDAHGTAQRKFTYRLFLPPRLIPKSITSIISSDGVLTISGKFGVPKGPKKK